MQKRDSAFFLLYVSAVTGPAQRSGSVLKMGLINLKRMNASQVFAWQIFHSLFKSTWVKWKKQLTERAVEATGTQLRKD